MEFVPIADCGMNKADWPSYTFEMLKPFFKGYDYHLIEIDHQFRRASKAAWQNVILNFNYYPDCFLVEVSFGARLDMVEELIAPYTYGVRGYQLESNTCITNMAKYRKEPHFRFKITEEQDLYRMAAWIRDFFRREGFAFLDSLLDYRELDHLFNAEPSKDCLLSFNKQLRCFRGLAIAGLRQNPHWEEIHHSYLALLKRYGSPDLIIDRYREFSRHLAATALN